MPALALALVLVASVCHATWNALAKRARHPLVFLWWANAGGTALLAPWAVAAQLWTGGFPPAALPFVAGTILLHGTYFYALGRAYAAGEYSLVYPIARGLSVALVPAVAWLVLEEAVSALGAAGIALVLAGIVALHLGPAGPAARPPGARRGAGTAWALATGLAICGYSLVDKVGVSRLHPVPYLALMGLGLTLLLLPAARRAAGETGLVGEWRRHRPTLVAGVVLTLGAYLLVLFAFQLGKVGYVVAARELSIVHSALIGTRWMGEGRPGPRLAASLLVLAGVACVALAR